MYKGRVPRRFVLKSLHCLCGLKPLGPGCGEQNKIGGLENGKNAEGNEYRNLYWYSSMNPLSFTLPRHSGATWQMATMRTMTSTTPPQTTKDVNRVEGQKRPNLNCMTLDKHPTLIPPLPGRCIRKGGASGGDMLFIAGLRSGCQLQVCSRLLDVCCVPT